MWEEEVRRSFTVNYRREKVAVFELEMSSDFFFLFTVFIITDWQWGGMVTSRCRRKGWISRARIDRECMARGEFSTPSIIDHDLSPPEAPDVNQAV